MTDAPAREAAGTGEKPADLAGAARPAADAADPLVFQVLNEIGIIGQLSRAAFEKLLPEGMFISHFSVLNHFVRLDQPSSPARLAAAFQVTRGAMTNTLQWLEARKLVSIRPDPEDGRAKIVTITARGRRLRDEAVAATSPLGALIAKEFGTGRLADMLPTLRAFRIFLDENRGR